MLVHIERKNVSTRYRLKTGFNVVAVKIKPTDNPETLERRLMDKLNAKHLRRFRDDFQITHIFK